MFQKKKATKNRVVPLPSDTLGAHTYGRQKSRREERKTERPRERKEVFSLVSFPFFFFFSSLSKSESRFLSREKTVSALEKRFGAGDCGEEHVYMSLGSETQDSETGPFVFSNAGARP